MKLSNYLMILCFTTMFTCAKMENYVVKVNYSTKSEPNLEKVHVNVGTFLEKSVIPEIKETLKFIKKKVKIPEKLSVTYNHEFEGVLQAKCKILLKQVSGYKNEAMKLGVDISECANGTIDKLLALPEKTNEPIKKCVKDKVDVVTGIIEKAEEDVIKKFRLAHEILKNSTDCDNKGAFEKQGCWIHRVNALNSAFPSNIWKGDLNVKKLTVRSQIAQFVRYTLPPCRRAKIVSFQVEGSTLVDSMISCTVLKFPEVKHIFEKSKKRFNSASTPTVTFYAYIVVIMTMF